MNELLNNLLENPDELIIRSCFTFSFSFLYFIYSNNITTITINTLKTHQYYYQLF